jgi:hypothetical protein
MKKPACGGAGASFLGMWVVLRSFRRRNLVLSLLFPEGFCSLPSWATGESLAQKLIRELGHRNASGLCLMVEDGDEKPRDGRTVMTVFCLHDAF